MLCCILLAVFAPLPGRHRSPRRSSTATSAACSRRAARTSAAWHAAIVCASAVIYCVGIAAVFCAEPHDGTVITQGTLKDLRDEMFTHMQTLPINYFDTHAHGDIMSRLHQRHRHPAPDDQPEPAAARQHGRDHRSACCIACSICNVAPDRAGLAMVGVMLLATQYLDRATPASTSCSSSRTLGKVNGYIEEMMNGQKVVKVFCHEEECHGGASTSSTTSCCRQRRQGQPLFADMLMPVNGQHRQPVSYVLVRHRSAAALAINGIGGVTLGGLASFLVLTLNRASTSPSARSPCS